MARSCSWIKSLILAGGILVTSPPSCQLPQLHMVSQFWGTPGKRPVTYACIPVAKPGICPFSLPWIDIKSFISLWLIFWAGVQFCNFTLLLWFSHFIVFRFHLYAHNFVFSLRSLFKLFYCLNLNSLKSGFSRLVLVLNLSITFSLNYYHLSSFSSYLYDVTRSLGWWVTFCFINWDVLLWGCGWFISHFNFFKENHVSSIENKDGGGRLLPNDEGFYLFDHVTSQWVPVSF